MAGVYEKERGRVMTDELWARRKAMLEHDLVNAAFDLMAFMGCAATKVPVPNTDPPVYIVVGEEKKIKAMMDIRPLEE